MSKSISKSISKTDASPRESQALVLFLVDDEASVLRTLARALTQLGHRVRTFGRSLDALAALSDERPDAVISDYYMPGASGVEFLQQVAEREPEIGRVILTGGFVDDRLQKAQAEGLVQILVIKPWSVYTLRSMLEHLQAGDRDVVLTDVETIRGMEKIRPSEVQKFRSDRRKGHVLVLDDDPFFLSLIGSTIRKLGYVCRALKDQERLFQELEMDPVDVVLVDLILPGTTGPDLIAQIRARYPSLPIFAITGSAERDLAVSALWKGANGLLAKPIDPELLEAALRRSLQFRDLFEEHTGRPELNALVELQHAIASGMDTDELLSLLLQQMIRFTGADNACVLLMESDGSFLRRAATYGLGGQIAQDRVELGEKVLDWAKDFHSPQLIMEIRDADPRMRVLLGSEKSAVGLCIPMWGREALLGVLCVSSQNANHPFSRDAVDIGLLLAGEAARAIEREAEAEQQRDIEQTVMRRDKLVTIGELASGVAHEINNPLAFVNSNLNSLEEHFKDLSVVLEVLGDKGNPDRLAAMDKRAEEVDIQFVLDDLPNCIEETHNGIERVLQIVNDLKGFVRDDLESREHADVNTILDGAVNILWNQIKYKAKLSKDFEHLPQIQCFPSQLGQLFLNLLYNAIQSIEREGLIELRTKLQEGYIVVEVADNGSGMDQQTQKKIFEPFFTTKPRGVGTGLGLSIGYKIVKRHGGQIVVSSEVGRGTVFQVKLPLGLPEKEA